MQNQPSPSRLRQAVKLIYAGLALTIVAALVLLIDVLTVDSVTDHVRDAYPDWPADLIRADRNAIVIYLALVGLLGVIGWLCALWVVARQKRAARVVTTGLFLVGAGVALLNLTSGSSHYEQIIPPLHSLVGLLPAMAGVAAVNAVWKLGPPSQTAGSRDDQRPNLAAKEPAHLREGQR